MEKKSQAEKKSVKSQSHKTVESVASSGASSVASSGASVEVLATPADAGKVIGQLKAVADPMHLRQPLTKEERKTQTAQANHASPAFISALALMSAQNGGKVAGIAFDSDAATATMARSGAGSGVVRWAQAFARTLGDDLLRDRAVVAGQASKVYALLGAYVETPEGASLRAEYEQLRALATKGRRKKKEAPAASEPVAAAPSGGKEAATQTVTVTSTTPTAPTT